MNILAEIREVVYDHKTSVLRDPFQFEPTESIDKDRERWGQWWDERYEKVTSKALREDGWLKALPLQFAALWADPGFWSLVSANGSTDQLANYISDGFFRISADGLGSCLFNAALRIKFKKADGNEMWYQLVKSKDARTAFVNSLLKFIDVEDYEDQRKQRPRLERFQKANVDRAFTQYLMYPRSADKREIIIRLGLDADDLSDLAKVAEEFASDCADVLARPKVRYFPDKRIAKKAGAPIKEANILQIERFVEQLLQDPSLTDYEMAKNAGSNKRAAKRARDLVRLRHSIDIPVWVEVRDGKRNGRRPSQMAKALAKMGP